ncbi:hypothetical protein [Mycobacterium heckeshornense]|nr:hypothetical protein [Mycobacterium heckeshornense]
MLVAILVLVSLQTILLLSIAGSLRELINEQRATSKTVLSTKN